MGKGICAIIHRLSSNNNFESTFALSNTEKEASMCLHWLKQKGSIRDYINDFTTLILEITDMSDKDSLFYFQDGLRIGPRWNLIGVVLKLSITPSPLRNHSLITSSNLKTRGLTKVKVRRGPVRGRKSLLATRVSKVNLRKSRPSLKAHASYVMAIICYVIV